MIYAARRRLQPGVHDAAAVRADMGAPAEVLKAPHGGEIDGKTTREELRRLLGPPNQEWLALNGWETIWDYRYWWAQQPWILRVGIDQKGVVTSQFRGTELSDSATRF